MRETIFVLDGKKKKKGAMRMGKYIKNTSLFFGICIAVVLLFGGVASAATYYVAPDGDDSNPGTEAQPWETIQKAADTLIAGDTVYIKSGTYNEQVIPKNSGSSGNYITYTAYPGDTVTIDGTGINAYHEGLFHIHRETNYIKVSGLNIANHLGGGSYFGIHIYYMCDHIIIENNHIYNTGGCGIYAYIYCSNIIIDNNEVSYTNLDPSGGQEMISLSGVNTFKIKNNHVHHSDNIGIDAKGGSSNGKIYNNHVHDCSSGIYLDSSHLDGHDIDVYNNVVHDCGGGIALATELGGTLENIKVYNNICYNNILGCSIHKYLGDAPDGSHLKKNIELINNNFCDNSVLAIQITEYGEHFQDLTIRNNILSSPKSWGMINFPHIVEENVNIDHNLFTGYSGVYGDNYLIGDPKFVNPSAADFHLQEDSPAIDNGSAVEAPGEDFDGNKRPQGAGYDIGAFEYVNDVVTGTISGTVTDRSTNPNEEPCGKPQGINSHITNTAAATLWQATGNYQVQGASVSDGTRSATTDETGSYSISDVPAGTYTVTCIKDGYLSASQDNVVVSEGTVITVDFTLTPSPSVGELVGYWGFDEGSGTTTIDASGNGNDGTINGASWTTGKLGAALHFDGIDDNVVVPDSSSISLSDAFTLEAWVYPTNSGGSDKQCIIAKGDGNNPTEYSLHFDDYVTAVEFKASDLSIGHTQASYSCGENVWAHLAVTYDGSTVKIYINGVLECSESSSGTIGDGVQPLEIGREEGSNHFFGTIDEVKIYNGALSAEEVRADYEAGFSNQPPYTPNNPSPSDGAMDVPIDAVFSWTGEDPDDGDTVTYDVYFGASISPPWVVENQLETNYNPDTLDYNTEYYWRIVATDNHGAFTEGKVWSFATIASSPCSDLVAEWHFDEGSGTVAVDTSGNGNDGTINGASWTTGKLGAALLFDGIDDNVVVLDSSSISLSDAFTLEAWVYPTNSGGSDKQCIIAKGDGNNPTEYSLHFDDYVTVVEFKAKDLSIGHTQASYSCGENVWAHLAVTYDGSTVKIYINGVLECSESSSGTIGDGVQPLEIGREEGSNHFFGTIDEVKIYNGALSAEEVRADYEAGFSNQPPYTPNNPSPSDGAIDVPIDAVFSWTGCDPDAGDTVTYDVYFGTSITPPLVAENQPETTYDPGTQDYNTEYYWRIEATDNHGATTEGEVWSFATTASSPDSDLVAEWNLDEGSGLTAVDTSGNGNDGAINGASWTTGKLGSALLFDGIDDNVVVPDSSSISLSDAFTLEAWVYPTNSGGSDKQCIIAKGDGNNPTEYSLHFDDYVTVVEFKASDLSIGYAQASYSCGENVWAHLVVTYDGSTVKIYINGVLKCSESSSGTIGDGVQPLEIGREEGSNHFFGTIDEVRIYNGALSAEEIGAING